MASASIGVRGAGVLRASKDDYRLARYDLTGLGCSDFQAYGRRRHDTLHGHASASASASSAKSLA